MHSLRSELPKENPLHLSSLFPVNLKVGIAPHPEDLKQKILDLIEDVTKAGQSCLCNLLGRKSNNFTLIFQLHSELLRLLEQLSTTGHIFHHEHRV